MGYTRLKAGAYLAIINETRMVEVHADNIESARRIAENVYGGNGNIITLCKIPEIIFYIGR